MLESVLNMLLLHAVILSSMKLELSNGLQKKYFNVKPFEYADIDNYGDVSVVTEEINDKYEMHTSYEDDTSTEKICGYQACPPIKEGMLNVHLVPHSHMDVGWLKTVNRYYYGFPDAENIESLGVGSIIDSVIAELLRNETRRFIFVETIYLWMWWKENDQKNRNVLQKLVNSGRIEIIGGGWSMNDEAVTHYQPTIDQFTLGFRKLDEMFGKCGRPKVGWQIDPFGHSRETASIMARLGFDGLFLGRIDFQDKAERRNKKEMEILWRGSPENLGRDSDIFTSVLYDSYATPNPFCFDVLCSYSMIIDDKNSSGFNADSMIRKFIKLAKTTSSHYLSKNVLVPMGRDFSFLVARKWYYNMDKLIGLINSKQSSGGDLNLIYSTPSCYLKAVNAENITFPVKTDDFFPYASGPKSYWTGFYTSRSAIKYFERKSNNFLQVCKQLYVLTNLSPEYEIYIDSLRSAMGILQHHDAITGTSKQAVAFDYALILSKGVQECEKVTNAALRNLIKKGEQTELPPKIQMLTCPFLNISECEISEISKTFLATVYNPLSSSATQFVRLPISGDKPDIYMIRSSKGKEVLAQIIPISSQIQNIPGRISKAKYELIFKAEDVPPLGFRSYYISRKYRDLNNNFQLSQKLKSTGRIVIGNPKQIHLMINNHGDMNIITGDGISTRFDQNFFYYESGKRSTPNSYGQQSGIYVFLPNSSIPKLIKNNVTMNIYKGPLVEEIHRKLGDWVSQIIRIHDGTDYIEFEWLVGPIPISDGIGKEVITRYKFPEIKADGVFYTDSNGREILRRKINHRSWASKLLEEPISGNYYPVTSKISIKDNVKQVSVLTDRPQGGTLQKRDNEIELMIHRRVLTDDNFGVEEGLDEIVYGTGLVTKGSHYLTIGNNNKQNITERLLTKEKYLQPWIFLTPLENISFEEWKAAYNMEYAGLTRSLPKNVHILTLEPWKEWSLLIRLEHIFEKEDDPEFSKPVVIDLKNLFLPFKILLIQEMTLGANLPLSDLRRLQWNPTLSVNETYQYFGVYNSSVIMLTPMQIRTFVIEIEYTRSFI